VAAKLDWFPFFTTLWLGDEQVGLMSLGARGAYVDALVQQWRHGSIPSDLRRLARLIRTDFDKLKKVWGEVADRFEPVPGVEGRVFNRTLSEIYKQQVGKSEAGRKGADARWHGAGESQEPEAPEPEPTTIEPQAVPDDLAPLELYAADKRLCKRWPELKQAWQQACPGIDVLAEVRKAHSWEVSNPSKRKKDRSKFLGNWMNRAQDSNRQGSNSRPQGNRLFSAAGQDAKEYENL
jgi:hypothetical protein